MVELNAASESGLVGAQYVSVHELVEMDRGVPFAEMQPGAVALRHYGPEREYIVLDVAPGLPAPQIWFSLCPRTGHAATSVPSEPDRTVARRDAMMNACAALPDGSSFSTLC